VESITNCEELVQEPERLRDAVLQAQKLEVSAFRLQKRASAQNWYDKRLKEAELMPDQFLENELQ
jgi:hypothetical protein